MALQVWLPLNGDFKNNGLYDLYNPILATGNSWTTSGKIAASSLALTKIQTILPQSSNMTGAKEMSYAFWVKVNTAWETQWLDGIRWITTDGSATFTSRQEFYTNCTRIGTWYAGGSISGKVFTPGVWTHIAATFNYNTGVVCFYLNGILQGMATNLSTTHYCRGDFYIGDSGVDILENDVRIYDHALSPKEVKEISKGLILHYKLDDSYWPYYNNLRLQPKSYNSTIYNAYQFNLMNNLIEGHTYTLQLWDVNVYHSAKTAAQTGVWVYWGGGSIQLLSWAGPTYFTQTSSTNYHADHLVKTFTITSAQANNSQAVNQWLNIYNSVPSANGTRSMSIGSWKLSEGDFVPPYSICEEDADWTPEYHRAYDCSGYGNHGAYSSSVSLAGDSIRHQYCAYIPQGNGDYIVSNEAIGNPSDAITMNIWLKSTCTTPGSSYHEIFNHATSSQYFEFAIHKNGYFRQGMVINGTRYVINGGSGLLDGKWHMLTATYDGSSIKRYIDGVIIDTMTQNITGVLTGANGKFLFGHYGPNTSYYAKEAYLSDARIYATALSDEDILQMYKTSTIIDNEQNLYAYDFIEDATKDVTHQGMFHSTSFTEETKVQVHNDGQVKANYLYEL